MALKGDYIGFSYNGFHSSDMGIIHVSDGSRYSTNLIPALTDKTVEVPGRDGTYFFGSTYKNQPFPISFATDEITEEKMVGLKRWLNGKEIAPLIFDETPYKKYMAKVTGTPTFKWICFAGEDDANRTYKGEGTVQFTCYYTYAKSVSKNYEDFSDWENNYEWKDASGLLNNEERSAKQIDVLRNNNTMTIYNPGDVETDWVMILPLTDLSNVSIEYHKDTATSIYGLHIENFVKNINDTTARYLRASSKTELLETVDSLMQPTGYIYNKYITEGNWFKIPVNRDLDNLCYIYSNGHTMESFEYDYLYY